MTQRFRVKSFIAKIARFLTGSLYRAGAERVTGKWRTGMELAKILNSEREMRCIQGMSTMEALTIDDDPEREKI